MAVLERVGSNNGWREARYVKERERMVEVQLRKRGITDERVLAAMGRVPRHLFVEEALRDQAYGDRPLPIGTGQTISQPYMVAIMCQFLALLGAEKVLEVGTGSGYQAAVLAELARKVYTVERIAFLAARARETLESLHYTNILVKVGDGTVGWEDEAPFDRVIVAAASPEVPAPLFQQLAEGGRMVVPVGDAHGQTLHVVEKVNGQMRVSTDVGCVFVRLIGKYGWGE